MCLHPPPPMVLCRHLLQSAAKGVGQKQGETLRYLLSFMLMLWLVLFMILLRANARALFIPLLKKYGPFSKPTATQIYVQLRYNLRKRTKTGPATFRFDQSRQRKSHNLKNHKTTKKTNSSSSSSCDSSAEQHQESCASPFPSSSSPTTTFCRIPIWEIYNAPPRDSRHSRPLPP